MAGRKSDFTLPTNTLDELFSSQEERDEAKLSKIRDIPLEEIDDFPDHPFQVREDEDMFQLVESIKERGVITPATVRQKEDGRYELISGHRRKRACELAGFETLRCEVVDLDRDEATILMVESNFQRSQILPSEKAHAYKMRLDAMKRQAGRPRKENSSPVGIDLRGKQSLDLMSEECGDIKAVEQPKKAVKESARSAGKKTIKTVGKGSAKTAQKTVKTAERTAKTTVKTAQRTAKAAQKTAQATVKASQRAVQAARAAARAAVVTAKAIAKAIALAVKAIIAGTKALIAAIAAGGWIAVLVIIVICLIGMIIGSVFGIFFSGEDSGTGMSMQTVVQEINIEYDTKLQDEKTSVSYDVLEMSGSRAVWKEVLAVYSVKVNTDPDNPQEVATMDESKKQLLTDIFWEMNEIRSSTDTKTETVITETDDGHGNIVETESTVTQTYLYITVSHKTADEMAAQYGFNEEQKEYLAELLADENNSLWSQVLYGITGTDDQIVTVALSQIGTMGGDPYWSWYGFNSRVEWCACFVSWCANECGYIDAGVIPKYAGCVNGVQWFKDRGQWLDNSAEPTPGMIIFFDWASGGQDGLSDHTGIVQKVENGRVYTVEGNSGDSVRQNSYPVGYYEILGYGAPAY